MGEICPQPRPAAAAEGAALRSDLEEARAALEMQHSMLQEQLQRIVADKEAQVQALSAALAEQQRCALP